jgi:hypothetical protein
MFDRVTLFLYHSSNAGFSDISFDDFLTKLALTIDDYLLAFRVGLTKIKILCGMQNQSIT